MEKQPSVTFNSLFPFGVYSNGPKELGVNLKEMQ
jgi:hypothetical protein